MAGLGASGRAGLGCRDADDGEGSRPSLGFVSAGPMRFVAASSSEGGSMEAAAAAASTPAEAADDDEDLMAPGLSGTRSGLGFGLKRKAAEMEAGSQDDDGPPGAGVSKSEPAGEDEDGPPGYGVTGTSADDDHGALPGFGADSADNDDPAASAAGSGFGGEEAAGGSEEMLASNEGAEDGSAPELADEGPPPAAEEEVPDGRVELRKENHKLRCKLEIAILKADNAKLKLADFEKKYAELELRVAMLKKIQSTQGAAKAKGGGRKSGKAR
eukprot:TRINITY_DN56764_c0_g1_i1.p1 TRINITY_DN56764_c0_g1~~TRINITY_DN56764_c0_g1_i1.p1  ORF type:complete len:271 (-),score=102.69 TRINITY_DN56764_c0_g1_i1:348-1160(-)